MKYKLLVASFNNSYRVEKRHLNVAASRSMGELICIGNITKLATSKTPDKLITDLAEYKDKNPSSKLNKLHFYAFGGIKKTSEWLNLISNSSLNIKDNNEFEPIQK